MALLAKSLKVTTGCPLKLPPVEGSLTTEQEQAVDQVSQWFEDVEDNVFNLFYRLGGCAGTGKTYIIPHIVASLGLKADEVAFCAYTGKAALVLKRKDINASTIHRVIYKPEEKLMPDGSVRVVFHKRFKLPSKLKLIVVDEASMVNRYIHQDLISYGIPVLYIGDYFQLPPIDDDKHFNLMDEHHLDYKLNTIHRQALNNPIIQISMKIRNGESVPFADQGNVLKVKEWDVTDEMLLDVKQTVCGKNDTRQWLNEYIRKIKGKSGLPKLDEKLIVLKNNYRLGVINGQQLRLLSDMEEKDSRTLLCKYIDEYDTTDVVKLLTCGRYENKFSKRPFAYVKAKEGKKEYQDRIVADFGYAITVHKSQGSEWESVMLFDDGFGKWNREYRRKWLYTAVTRATDKLVWVVK